MGLMFVEGVLVECGCVDEIVCCVGLICESNFGVLFDVELKLCLDSNVYMLLNFLLYIDLLMCEL